MFRDLHESDDLSVHLASLVCDCFVTYASHELTEDAQFCTIDPNEARCAVPDARYDKLVQMWQPASEYPAYLQITDIAGLVKGAAAGAGLGNAFLSHIQAVDGIFHVVRAFESEEVIHVDESPRSTHTALTRSRSCIH